MRMAAGDALRAANKPREAKEAYLRAAEVARTVPNQASAAKPLGLALYRAAMTTVIETMNRVTYEAYSAGRRLIDENFLKTQGITA